MRKKPKVNGKPRQQQVQNGDPATIKTRSIRKTAERKLRLGQLGIIRPAVFSYS